MLEIRRDFPSPQTVKPRHGWFTHPGNDNERETPAGQTRFDAQRFPLSTKNLTDGLTRCRKHRGLHLSLLFLSIAQVPTSWLRSCCSRHSNRSFPIGQPTTLRQVKRAEPLRLIPDPGRCLRPRPRWLASRGSRLREPARPSLPSAQGKT